jgi:hypothetical protein
MIHDRISFPRVRWSLLPLLLGSYLLASCGNEALNKPGVDSDTATTKTCSLTCRDLKNCRLLCEGDAACVQACDALASTEAKAAWSAAQACVDAHGCKDDACLTEFCAAPISACLPPIPAGVQPPKFCAPTCGELVGCQVQCHDDATCRQTCSDTAIPMAKKDYDAALACAKANGCSDILGCQASACSHLLGKCR